VHDRFLLDALERKGAERFAGPVWRVTRAGRNPLRGVAAHGRWSVSGEFEVLYTSLEREGALAEIGYRLGLESVWPLKIEHEVHRIDVRTERTLRFAALEELAPLGVEPKRYETLDYSATQAISAAAHFLEFDGIIVPSARYPSANLVLFMDRMASGARLELKRSDPVDWSVWRPGRRG
jgi:hypothetical protein